MKKFHLTIAALLSALIISPQSAHAQAAPDFAVATNQLELFQQQCFGNFPDFHKIRSDAAMQSWVVGPLGPSGEPVSWAVNYGGNNFSLMIAEDPSISSKSCEVVGRASFDTVASAFDGMYASRLKAQRTGAPESTWRTPNGLVTISPYMDGRTSIKLAK